MDDMYDLTIEVISDFLEKESFSMKELERKIKEKGAPMRVAPTLSVRDYLFELQGDGIIVFRPSKNKFQKVTALSNDLNLTPLLV
jgi:hypothetical protein